jgi:hypothetical protein
LKFNQGSRVIFDAGQCHFTSLWTGGFAVAVPATGGASPAGRPDRTRPARWGEGSGAYGSDGGSWRQPAAFGDHFNVRDVKYLAFPRAPAIKV